jgi:hypothetical protein
MWCSKKESAMLKKRLLLALGLAALGTFFSTRAADLSGLRICNETGEKLHITVSWILPGDDSSSFLTRESSGKKSGLGVFSSICRVFGPVSKIHSVTWFTEAQWGKFSKSMQDKLQGKDRSNAKGVSTSAWYKPSFADSNLRRVTLSKDKDGKIYVKEDKKWSLNPAKLSVFKKLNPFKSEEEDL